MVECRPALQRSMTHCGDTAAPRGGLPYVIAQCSSQPLPSSHDPCFELDRRFRRDGFGCCSAECDAIVEAEFERTLAADPQRRAQLEREGRLSWHASWLPIRS